MIQVPNTQIAQILTKYGEKPFDCFQFKADYPVQTLLGPTQVLVRLETSCLDPHDCKIRRGESSNVLNPRPPTVLGTDGAGVIVKQGGRVNESLFDLGDEVFGRTSVRSSGTNCQYAVFDCSDLAQKPKDMTWKEAACMPTAAITAWRCIHKCKSPETRLRGSNVLVIGASGGIGSWAIMLLKYYCKANVYAVCSGKNADYVQKLGADVVIDYTSLDYTSYFEKLGERPIRLVVDCVGGYENMKKCYSLLTTEDGHYATMTTPHSQMSISRLTSFGASMLWRKAKSLTRNEPDIHYISPSASGKELQLVCDWAEENGDLYKKIPLVKYDLKELDKAHEEQERERLAPRAAITIPKLASTP